MADDLYDASVIIPAYNVEQFLPRCLDSLINQRTSYSYEIVCVDDCGSDHSLSVLTDYQSRYPDTIRVIQNARNKGAGLSRDAGIAAARGKYILFVDGDDYVADDYLQTYIETADKGFDIVVGGYTKDIDGDYTPYRVPDSIWCIVTYAIGCAKLFKRSFLLEHDVRFSSIRCGEDIYFNLSALCARPTYKVIDYVGYRYVLNRESATSSIRPDQKFELHIVDIYRKFLADHPTLPMDSNEFRLVEYSYLANIVNSLFVYDRGCEREELMSRYQAVRKATSAMFPSYLSNPYGWLPRSKGQPLKIRLGVSGYLLLVRLGLDRIALSWIASR